MKDAITAASTEGCWSRLKNLPTPSPKPQHETLARASVLVLLDDRLHTFITKRSMQLRSHPGECCFPGGRQDDEDNKNDAQTALREAQEEVGLDPDDVRLLGRLPTTESVNHLCVTPILAKFISKDPASSYPWKINAAEVDTAFWLPLRFFSEEPESKFDVEWSGEIFTMRTYVYRAAAAGGDNQQAYQITGLTAHIAHQAAVAAFGRTVLVPRAAAISSPFVNTNNDGSTTSTKSSGDYLWRRQESSRGRTYWTRRFFVIATADQSVLHQYDNPEQAHRKQQSATKKNRLPLENAQVLLPKATSASTTSSSSSVPKFEFTLHAMEGRVCWYLATESLKERDAWIARLSRAAS